MVATVSSSPNAIERPELRAASGILADAAKQGTQGHDSAAIARAAVNKLADLLENTQGNTAQLLGDNGKKIHLSRWEGPKLGSSAVVSAEYNGKLYLAFVRKQNENELLMPAGYINVHQSNTLTASGVQQDAVSYEKVKPVLEAAYLKEIKELGWQQAGVNFEDPGHMRDVLKAGGIDYPPCCDVSQLENVVREVREETGLDWNTQHKSEGSHLLFVEAPTSLSISSGGVNAMTTAPQFTMHLGKVDKLPDLKPEDVKEIGQALWVDADAIRKDADGRYQVPMPDGKTMPINVYEAPKIQKALNTSLSQKLQDASLVHAPGSLPDAHPGSAFHTADSVQTAVYREVSAHPGQAIPANVSWLATQKLHIDGTLPELLGQDGQQAAKAFVAAADYLSKSPVPTLGALDAAIGQARGLPSTNMTPASVVMQQAQPAFAAIPSTQLPAQHVRLTGGQAQAAISF